MNEKLPQNYKAHYGAMPTTPVRGNITWYHRCAMPRYQTARERLGEKKHLRLLAHNRRAGQRKREEALYEKLKAIVGTHKTRGAWYDTEKRAEILAGYIDLRNIKN